MRQDYVDTARLLNDIAPTTFCSQRLAGAMKNDACHVVEEMVFVVSDTVEVALPAKSVLLRTGDVAQSSVACKTVSGPSRRTLRCLIVVTRMDGAKAPTPHSVVKPRGAASPGEMPMSCRYKAYGRIFSNDGATRPSRRCSSTAVSGPRTVMHH